MLAQGQSMVNLSGRKYGHWHSKSQSTLDGFWKNVRLCFPICAIWDLKCTDLTATFPNYFPHCSLGVCVLAPLGNQSLSDCGKALDVIWKKSPLRGVWIWICITVLKSRGGCLGKARPRESLKPRDFPKASLRLQSEGYGKPQCNLYTVNPRLHW